MMVIAMLIHNALNKLNLMNDDDNQGNVGQKCSKKLRDYLVIFPKLQTPPIVHQNRGREGQFRFRPFSSFSDYRNAQLG